MRVLFVGDPHFGHRRIVELSKGTRPVTSTDDHDAWVMQRLLSLQPTKRTLWYLLGDIAFDEYGLDRIASLPGRKILVRGNHDVFGISDYLTRAGVEDVTGTFKRYGIWISHVPMHPLELWGKPNLHGHCHRHTLRDDSRYFNAALEWLPEQRPITLDELRPWITAATAAMGALEVGHA